MSRLEGEAGKARATDCRVPGIGHWVGVIEDYPHASFAGAAIIDILDPARFISRAMLRIKSNRPVSARWREADWSLVVMMAIYLVAVMVMWRAIHNRTGEISYTLDDAYIHATIAKNLSAHGTFGIIPGEFAAASSSPLWSLLLALVFAVIGIHSWIPAVLATLFGALIIGHSNSLLKGIDTGPVARVVVVILAVAYAPLLPILSTGMEHTFHAWALLGLFTSLIAVSRETRRNPGSVFVWAVLAAGARYESLFALPPLLIWLALRRKWSVALELAGGMALPVLGFAAYSVTHGGYALPNSLMLKGNIEGAWNLRALRLLFDNRHLLILVVLLVIATVVGIFNGNRRNERLAWLPVTVIAMILIHLQLAQLGWFWRYEGYLVILGMVAASTLLAPLRDWLRGRSLAVSLPVYTLLMYATLPLYLRCISAIGMIVHAAGNIRDQQLQMARVVRHLGEGARVAVNDLGAVSFFTDARVLDLWGLGDNRIARAKRNHIHGDTYLKARLAETRTDFVICYPSAFEPPNRLPASLIAVETWKLRDNLICGSDTVVFYGTSPQAAEKMAAALDRYRADSKPDPRSTNEMHPIPIQ